MPDAYDARYSQATLALLGKQLLRMAGNPKTRRSILNAHRENTPGFVMPPDVQIQEMREQNAREKAADKLARETEKSNERLEREKAKLAKRYSPEQIEIIEKEIMPKYGISDYEAAGKLYAADFKPAAGSGGTDRGTLFGATWTFPDLPGLLDDPAKAARETAFSVIDEFNRR